MNSFKSPTSKQKDLRSSVLSFKSSASKSNYRTSKTREKFLRNSQSRKIRKSSKSSKSISKERKIQNQSSVLINYSSAKDSGSNSKKSKTLSSQKPSPQESNSIHLESVKTINSTNKVVKENQNQSVLESEIEKSNILCKPKGINLNCKLFIIKKSFFFQIL